MSAPRSWSTTQVATLCGRPPHSGPDRLIPGLPHPGAGHHCRHSQTDAAAALIWNALGGGRQWARLATMLASDPEVLELQAALCLPDRYISLPAVADTPQALRALPADSVPTLIFLADLLRPLQDTPR